VFPAGWFVRSSFGILDLPSWDFFSQVIDGFPAFLLVTLLIIRKPMYRRNLGRRFTNECTEGNLGRRFTKDEECAGDDSDAEMARRDIFS
jgi:hypothetical protein